MSFDDEAVQRYEIERIVSKRTTQQGFTEYYIKWKDYNDDENTWEPLENLIEDKAFEVIFNFENSEETKAKLRGARLFFTGDKNNSQVQILQDGEIKPCGAIYLTDGILKEFQEILGNENAYVKDI